MDILWVMGTLVTAVVIIWATEMTILAANGWKVKRNTPMTYFLGAQGSSFCSVFWGTLALYFLGSYLVLSSVFILSNIVVGVASICGGLGMQQELYAYITLSFAVIFVVVKTLGYVFKRINLKVSNTKNLVAKFSEDQKKIKAVKEVYKALKEKYCPIIK